MNTAALPEIAAIEHPADGTAVMVKRGEPGYYPSPYGNRSVAFINRMLGVTPRQAEAMAFGSMFGFDKPGADPSSTVYDKLPESY